MKFILPLFCLGLTLLGCNDTTGWKTKIDNLKAELAACQATQAETEISTAGQTEMVHSVFFWLKEELSDADRISFLEGLQSLQDIVTVQRCYIGPPAATEARGVVDNSFDYALLVHFADVDGQNAYQVDPIHLQFVADHQEKWTKVIVYDSAVQH